MSSLYPPTHFSTHPLPTHSSGLEVLEGLGTVDGLHVEVAYSLPAALLVLCAFIVGDADLKQLAQMQSLLLHPVARVFEPAHLHGIVRVRDTELLPPIVENHLVPP